MKYVKRDDSGQITAISTQPEPGFELEQGDVGGEVAAFMLSNRSAAELDASDLKFIRVIDDLLELLMAKGVLNFTDLPPEAQTKFMARSQLRARWRGALDLLGDDEIL